MSNQFNSIIEKISSEESIEKKIIKLYEKVRDIPYGNIGSRDPIDVYTHNKGTCSGKHELLKNLYGELGIPVKNFIIMHKFKDLPVKFPNHIKKILNRTDIIDPHNFLKIKIDGNWVQVDITWDLPLKKLGFPVVEDWDGNSDMKLAVALGGEVHETENPIDLKKELLNKLPENVSKQRKLFLNELTLWLDEFRNNNIEES